jgi:hypothetical protein
MVHQNMKNDFKGEEELYIKRCCLVLEDFICLLLYLFPSIAMEVTTLK